MEWTLTPEQILREERPGVFVLHHGVLPEVQAMLLAMVSRAPAGGLRQRLAELIADVGGVTPLFEYPLHPRVQRFISKWVGQYGHSSPRELTGRPAVYIEGLSWLMCSHLFDSSLVIGQENSTRAVARDGTWPMARDASPRLQLNHDYWMGVYRAELTAWEKKLEDPAERAARGIEDKEPFRPALDRARWALPGTISTGASFCSHIRERDATLDRMGTTVRRLANTNTASGRPVLAVLQGIRQGYWGALPGFYFATRPVHPLDDPHDPRASRSPWEGRERYVAQRSPHRGHAFNSSLGGRSGRGAQEGRYSREKARGYLDRRANGHRVDISILCGIAQARDFMRHRTGVPWTASLQMFPVRPAVGPVSHRITETVCIDPAYEILTPEGREALTRLPELLDTYLQYQREGDEWQGILQLPLGTLVHLQANMGLRDALYMAELRSLAKGADFVYKEAANDLRWDFWGMIGLESFNMDELQARRAGGGSARIPKEVVDMHHTPPTPPRDWSALAPERR